jgi:hypothetical protein
MGGGGKKLTPKQEAQAESDAWDRQHGSYRAGDVVRPTGKAPRGMGGEYAARRAIANRLDTLQDRIGSLQGSLSTNKGQKDRRWQDTRNRDVLGSLRVTLNASSKIATGPGDWSFKRELINDLIVSQQGR